MFVYIFCWFYGCCLILEFCFIFVLFVLCVCFFVFYGFISFYGIRLESFVDKCFFSLVFKVGFLEYLFLCRKNFEEGLFKLLVELWYGFVVGVLRN